MHGLYGYNLVYHWFIETYFRDIEHTCVWLITILHNQISSTFDQFNTEKSADWNTCIYEFSSYGNESQF